LKAVFSCAIGAGVRLKSPLALHRDYSGVASARRRAPMGQILGWIAAGLYLLSFTGVQCSILG
jgi:hypothetical protein